MVYKEVVTKDGRTYTNYYVLVDGVRVPIRPVHWSLNSLLDKVAKVEK